MRPILTIGVIGISGCEARPWRTYWTDRDVVDRIDLNYGGLPCPVDLRPLTGGRYGCCFELSAA